MNQKQMIYGKATGIAIGSMKTLPPRHRKRRRSQQHQQQPYSFSFSLLTTKVVIVGTIILVIYVIGYNVSRIAMITIHSWTQQDPSTTAVRPLISMEIKSSSENYHYDYHQRLFDLPHDDIDLWLDSTNEQLSIEPSVESILRQYMLQNCLPNDNLECSSGVNSNIPKLPTTTTATERIGIVRPPGLLGHILEDYIVQYIQHTGTGSHATDDDTDIDIDDIDRIVIAQPNRNSNHEVDWMTYTKLIRPIVMPILLEALDLIIQTTGNDYPMENVTMNDVMRVLRILMQWQCYIAQMATTATSNHYHYHRPTLTISLHRFMTYPQEVNDNIIEFLQLQHPNVQRFKTIQKQNMDVYAEIIFHRIDTCTMLLNRIRNNYTTTRTGSSSKPVTSFTDMLNEVIRDELNHGYCSIKDDTNFGSSSRTNMKFRMDWHGIIVDTSRVNEIIGTVFIDNSLSNICIKYPQALLCIDDPITQYSKI
jgi:hypothetical protein